MAPKKNAPHGCGNNRVEGRYKCNTQLKSSISKFSGQNFIDDRACLPTPSSYYSNQFPGISTDRTMAKVLCPFHDDHHPSLSINIEAGWYRCHACGAKGGGITKFHMTRYSLTYKQTIKELEIPCHIKILK